MPIYIYVFNYDSIYIVFYTYEVCCMLILRRKNKQHIYSRSIDIYGRPIYIYMCSMMIHHNLCT
jgi:hypothetical protein